MDTGVLLCLLCLIHNALHVTDVPISIIELTLIFVGMSTAPILYSL